MDTLRRWSTARTVDASEAPGTRILFVHIPKTAGMSLFHALEGWATRRRAIRFPNGGQVDIDAWLALPSEHIERLRVIAGHLPLPDFERRDVTGWSPITLLRDPVARTLSTYSYIRGERKHPWHRIVSAMDLDGFLDWFAGRPANRDQQCAFITRDRTADAAYDVLSERFVLAGTVERLDTFHEALSEILGGEIRMPRRNRSHDPIDASLLSAATITRIRELQAEDVILHQRLLDVGLLGTRGLITREERPGDRGVDRG